MTKQIVKIEDLEYQLRRLNTETGSPLNPWHAGKSCRGNYHLSQAYGGYNVYRMVNEAGGVMEPAGGGHVPKRECLERIKSLRYHEAIWWEKERERECAE
jgi:hypothetical protein